MGKKSKYGIKMGQNLAKSTSQLWLEWKRALKSTSKITVLDIGSKFKKMGNREKTLNKWLQRVQIYPNQACKFHFEE